MKSEKLNFELYGLHRGSIRPESETKKFSYRELKDNFEKDIEFSFKALEHETDLLLMQIEKIHFGDDEESFEINKRRNRICFRVVKTRKRPLGNFTKRLPSINIPGQ